MWPNKDPVLSPTYALYPKCQKKGLFDSDVVYGRFVAFVATWVLQLGDEFKESPM